MLNINKFFKSLAMTGWLLFSVDVLAQVNSSNSAYKTGHLVGQWIGRLILVMIVIVVIRKLWKLKNKRSSSNRD